MSGNSGSGNPFFGESGSSSRQTRCEDINSEATIISPDPDVLNTLSRGDILIIQAQGARGPILAITQDRRPLGSILITDFAATLLGCLNNGVLFQGRIISITGGQCRIQITSV